MLVTAERRTWLMVVGEAVGALGLLVIIGSAIAYVIDASSTAASAEQRVERVEDSIDAIERDVRATREDVAHIRGVIDAEKRGPK